MWLRCSDSELELRVEIANLNVGSLRTVTRTFVEQRFRSEIHPTLVIRRDAQVCGIEGREACLE